MARTSWGEPLMLCFTRSGFSLAALYIPSMWCGGGGGANPRKKKVVLGLQAPKPLSTWLVLQTFLSTKVSGMVSLGAMVSACALAPTAASSSDGVGSALVVQPEATRRSGRIAVMESGAKEEKEEREAKEDEE